MRGHVHDLRLVGQRATVTVPAVVEAGEVVVDSEGRWIDDAVPNVTPGKVAEVRLRGRIGFVKSSEVPEGIVADSAAHFEQGTVVPPGYDVIANTGDPALDGRYEVVGVQPGPAMVRVLLKRSS